MHSSGTRWAWSRMSSPASICRWSSTTCSRSDHTSRLRPLARERRGRTFPDFLTRGPDEMELWIDEAEAQLTPLRAFILPGGSAGARALHLCRTVCRRAERSAVRVFGEDPGASFAVRYLNRLSDLLFVLARVENQDAGMRDIHWQQEP